jgi:hypothetical protein
LARPSRGAEHAHQRVADPEEARDASIAKEDASVVASPLKSVCTTLLVHNTAISAPAACAASTSGS